MPDLERLLSRIHAHSLGQDEKEVMYGNVTGAKLEQFLRVLRGFEEAKAVLQVACTHANPFAVSRPIITTFYIRPPPTHTTGQPSTTP